MGSDTAPELVGTTARQSYPTAETESMQSMIKIRMHNLLMIARDLTPPYVYHDGPSSRLTVVASHQQSRTVRR